MHSRTPHAVLAVLCAAGCQESAYTGTLPARIVCGPGTPASADVEEDLRIDTVCVRQNAANVLSLTVNWSTAEPATSVVQFGEDGRFEWQVDQEELVTQHEVTIWGLHAETEVVVRVRSVLADGRVAESSEIVGMTGSLPESVPVGFVGAWDADRVEPGLTLMNVSNKEAGWPPTAVMYDPAGHPVWYAITEPDATDRRGDLDVSLTPDGTVLVGGSGPYIAPVELNMAGHVVWEGPPQEWPEQHHHIEKLDDGSYVMLRHAEDPDWPGLSLDQIVQIDADHETLWTWSAFDHLALPDTATGDFTHMNALTVDGEHVYVNSRNLSTLFKLDRATGEVLWRLGRGRDFAADLDAADPWFSFQHAPELQEDGSWLFYDNDGLDDHTRVLQLAIDEDLMTSEVVWEFPGDAAVDAWYLDDWHSEIWGDVDRLDNGNVLVTAGTRDTDDQSRVFEVTPEGEVVWEMLLPEQGGDWVTGTYRAERIDPPGLEPVEPVE